MRMKHAWKVVLLGATLFACAAARAQDESCAVDREFLKGLLGIPSVTADKAKTDEAVAFVRARLESRGVVCAEERGEDGRRILYASTRGEKTPDYLLVCHLDVVPAAPDQFAPRFENGRVCARGAHDSKGNAAMAVQVLCDVGRRASVGAVFATDEETGGKTTARMAKLGYVPRRMAIVIDAGTTGVFYAQKGNFDVRVRAVGRGGHSSMPWTCANPIDKLMAGWRAVAEAWPKPPADCWGDYATPTVVAAGDARNKIPDAAEMWINLRYVNPDAPERLLKLLKERGGFEIAETRLTGGPMASDRDDPELRRLLAVRQRRWPKDNPGFVRMMAMTDATHYAASGIPVAIIGSMGGNAHANGEWDDLKSIDENAASLKEFLLGANWIRS